MYYNDKIFIHKPYNVLQVVGVIRSSINMLHYKYRTGIWSHFVSVVRIQAEYKLYVTLKIKTRVQPNINLYKVVV